MVAAAPGTALGGLAQTLVGRGTVRLRFFGTHAFDLLDKLDSEGGAGEVEKRSAACLVLNAVALRGAPVVRIWGTLKRTGSAAEIERARDMLGLLLDENARRKRPLRFVVSLLNHQPGYGQPDPENSLDDQKAPGWSAGEVYLRRGWARPGVGQLAERIERYRDDPRIRLSPYVLVWELVNELDSHRSVASGSLSGSEADRLISSFLAPASELLAQSFAQPIAIGDLRGRLGAYDDFVAALLRGLSAAARGRLVWTSHVYVDTAVPAPSARERRALVDAATRKLDLDLALAKKFGLPLLLGEIGQHVRGARSSYCKGGAAHDVAALLQQALAPDPDPSGRRSIEAALFWGDGMCGLAISEDGARRMSVGAGGDSADLGPDEAAARQALEEARRWTRFIAR